MHTRIEVVILPKLVKNLAPKISNFWPMPRKRFKNNSGKAKAKQFQHQQLRAFDDDLE